MPTRIFKAPQINNAKTAAEFIFENLSPSKSNFEFSGTLAIAPTRSAAKAVLGELARLAQKKFGGGIAGLEVLTVEAFLSRICSNFACANSAERIFALNAALGSFGENSLPFLFPQGVQKSPMPKSFFKKFLEIKTLCANALLGISDAAEKTEKYKSSEAPHWRELAQLDEAYVEILRGAGKIDPSDAPLEFLKTKTPAPKKIFLAGVADAPKIFRRILEKFEEQGSEIFSVVFAEEALAEAFDSWGAPIPEVWTQKNIETENSSIFTPADRAAQARLLAGHAAEIADAPQNCAIACEEGESAVAISQALANRGLKSFSAEGEKLSDGEIFDFLKSLKNYCLEGDFFALESLARKSASLGFLEKSASKKPEEVLEAADFYALKKLCPDLDSALKFRRAGSEKREVLSGIKAMLGGNGETQNSQKIAQILQNVFSKTSTFDKNISAEAESLSKTLAQISAAEKLFGGAGIRDTIDTLASCADARVFGSVRAPDEIQINNWLEIFWSGRQNIFLADFNDGQVPENISADAYLPNSLREFLGIRAAKSRHARDAYFLYCILKPRPGGSVKIYAPKADFNSDPLRPSRLLLQTSDILKRIKHIIKPSAADKHSSAFSHSWKFKIPRAEIPERLNATDFKTYLECPFNFYLSRVLKLSPLDTKKREPDDMEVGTIIHKSLQRLKDFEGEKEEEIFDFLKGEFERAFALEYGEDFGGILKFLRLSLLSRLRYAAKAEARHRGEGWRTLCAETDFGKLEICGKKINAKIDRIDRNEGTGEYMVIDYKTAASDISPKSDHLTLTGPNKGWTNLQLPLYAESANLEFGVGAKILSAYFVLPNASSKTEIKKWEISETERASAMEKASQIVEKILNREFEPGPKSPLAKRYPELFGFAGGGLSKFLEFEK